jgi:Putative transposase
MPASTSRRTTHIVIEPLDFMARLAALVPPPRMRLARDHGVFVPHSKLRAAVTPAHRGTSASKPRATAAESAEPPTPRRVAMSWARRLKRVFGIEIEDCARCGGQLKVIAGIEEPAVIAAILAQWGGMQPDLGRFRGRADVQPGCWPPDWQSPRGRRSARSRHEARPAK